MPWCAIAARRRWSQSSRDDLGMWEMVVAASREGIEWEGRGDGGDSGEGDE